MPIWADSFDVITDPLIAQWAEGSVPDTLSQELSTRVQAIGSPEGLQAWQQLCYEVCSRVAIRSITVANAAEFLQKTEIQDNAKESIIDAVWVLTQQTNSKEPEFGILKDLIVALVKEKILSEIMCQSMLEFPFLEACKLIDKANSFEKRLRKINTDQFYKQQKYNLLREETEGYSKLTSVLGTLNAAEVDNCISHMLSLIGHFDLDPNRVLSLTLDAYERDLMNIAFVPVINQFKRSYLPHILGFKLAFYTSPDAEAALEEQDLYSEEKEEGEGEEGGSVVTPKALYMLTANLLTHNLVTLEEVMPYFSPSLDKLAQQASSRHKAMVKAADSVGHVNLNAAGTEERAKVEIPAFSDDNQVLGMLEAVIRMRAWDVASDLCNVLESAGCPQTIYSHPPVRKALVDLIHSSVEPLYDQISPRSLKLTQTKSSKKHEADSDDQSGSSSRDPLANVPHVPNALPQATDYASLIQVLKGPLGILGVGLHTDVLLFIKICRLLLNLLKGSSGSELWERTEIREGVCNIITSVLLPTVSLLGVNPGAVLELWGLLNQLPYELRCHLYTMWIGDDTSIKKDPEVQKAEAEASHSMKQLLKRISSDRKKLKQDSRQVARLAHSNPMVVFGCVISNAVSYDNQIGPLVESLTFFTPFALDCASFMIVRHLKLEMGSGAGLAGMMSKKFEGAVADWFRNLATFIGAFYRNHSNVEIQGLLHFIIGKLNEGSSWELIIIKEILAKVGGCEYLENQNEEQSSALAGGEVLRREMMNTVDKEPKKYVRRKLADALMQPETGLSLLVLIAQQRNVVLYHSSAKELKLVGETFDRCQVVLMQLVDFLSRQRDAYGTILPNFRALCQEMHVEPQVALYMARPLIRAAAASHALGKVPAGHLAPWHMQAEPMQEHIRAVLPPETWHSLSMQCYTTFWGLTLQDIHTPRQLYEQRITSLRRAADSDFRQNRKREGRAKEKLAEELKVELEAQEKHVKATLEGVSKVKDGFFQGLKTISQLKEKVASVSTDKDKQTVQVAELLQVVNPVIQHCLLPRVLLSEEDAQFCAHFVALVHDLEPASFSTLQLFDRLVKMLVPTVFCVTEREAANLGIFLRVFLGPIVRWFLKRSAFSKEAETKKGFCLRPFDADVKPPSYPQYRQVFTSWHKKILETIQHCLDSKEKFLQRAGLSVLLKIVPIFPVFQDGYDTLWNLLNQLSQKGADGMLTDINTVALALKGQLEKRQKEMIGQSKQKKPAAAASSAAPESRATSPPAAGRVTSPTPSSNAPEEGEEVDESSSDNKKDPPPPAKKTVKESSSKETTSSKTGKGEQWVKKADAEKTEESARSKSSDKKEKHGEKEKSKKSSKRETNGDRKSEKEDRHSRSEKKSEEKRGKGDAKADRSESSSSRKRSRSAGRAEEKEPVRETKKDAKKGDDRRAAEQSTHGDRKRKAPAEDRSNDHTGDGNRADRGRERKDEREQAGVKRARQPPRDELPPRPSNTRQQDASTLPPPLRAPPSRRDPPQQRDQRGGRSERRTRR